MVTIKSYTDLEQSRKLAEILPIESADMAYIASATDDDGETLYTAEYKSEIIIYEADEHVNCWSLAALLNYIKDKCGYVHVYIGSRVGGKANKLENVNRLSTDIYDVYENELVDACYEMILKLNELKLL